MQTTGQLLNAHAATAGRINASCLDRSDLQSVKLAVAQVLVATNELTQHGGVPKDQHNLLWLLHQPLSEMTHSLLVRMQHNCLQCMALHGLSMINIIIIINIANSKCTTLSRSSHNGQGLLT